MQRLALTLTVALLLSVPLMAEEVEPNPEAAVQPATTAQLDTAAPDAPKPAGPDLSWLLPQQERLSTPIDETMNASLALPIDLSFRVCDEMEEQQCPPGCFCWVVRNEINCDC